MSRCLQTRFHHTKLHSIVLTSNINTNDTLLWTKKKEIVHGFNCLIVRIEHDIKCRSDANDHCC